jgi:hypothetical protein
LLTGKTNSISFKSSPKVKKVAEWDGLDHKPSSSSDEDL